MLPIEFVKVRLVRSNSIAFLMATFLALTLISQETWAREKVNNATAVRQITRCMLSDDASEKTLADGSYACCSKSEGFCIWCPTNPDKPCINKPTKLVDPNGTPPFITIVNPAFFTDETETEDKGQNNRTLSPIKNFILRNKAESVETEKYNSGK